MDSDLHSLIKFFVNSPYISTCFYINRIYRMSNKSSSEMRYISVNLYRKVIDHAIYEGMSPSFFSNLPIPLDSLDSVQAVQADQFFALHELIDEQLGPGFAVRVGQQMKMNDYGVLGMSWKTCSKAGEIFERSERYFKLLSNTYVFKVVEEHEISKIYLMREAYRKGVELSNEATFSATVVVLQAITGMDIKPTGVSFMHSAPSDLQSHDQAFKCPLFFDQSQYFISFKTQDLSMRSIKADDSINQFLLERVKECEEGIEVKVGKLASDVKALIRDALPSGIPSLLQISDHLGMSNRTLTRRLSDSGIKFRALIQETQADIAQDLLKKSSHNIGEIAFQTGFSEQSAFNRAFKRWTGLSPVEYRRNKA